MSVYFPGSGPWYDVWTMEKLELTGAHNMPAPYEKVRKTFLHWCCQTSTWHVTPYLSNLIPRLICPHIHQVPVYQRGGTIVPKRERVRRSAALMHQDPVSLVVAPDRDGKAKGRLYLDDGESFKYREGAR